MQALSDWACRGRSAVDRGPEPGQWLQNLVLLVRQVGQQGVGEQVHDGPQRGHPRTGSVTRATSAAPTRDSRPAITWCPSVSRPVTA